ncbi:hypothetical protein M8C21_013760 [Ambrosia artemisiifolia]|uniref:Peptidase C1A papain C-terminal domain-containing protein n=1 Tax=Ambrosia artemisiifolia TaxID=4212 RepID=A0AAD5BWE5_AMBAR|nr:hypothetical protein M8C21_013760 [Ambrosia artemisiifolia]
MLTPSTCWAFAATATLEALHKISTGETVTLSEQQLFDCDKKFNLHGSVGGYVIRAYCFVIDNGGLCSDIDYPYRGPKGGCSKEAKNVTTIDGICLVTPNNEKALKIVGICEVPFHYNKDHAVTIVGYGTEDGKDYWICRNSYGVSWGAEGYFRLRRNVEDPRGIGGIAMSPLYPWKE